MTYNVNHEPAIKAVSAVMLREVKWGRERETNGVNEINEIIHRGKSSGAKSLPCEKAYSRNRCSVMKTQHPERQLNNVSQLMKHLGPWVICVMRYSILANKWKAPSRSSYALAVNSERITLVISQAVYLSNTRLQLKKRTERNPWSVYTWADLHVNCMPCIAEAMAIWALKVSVCTDMKRSRKRASNELEK